MIICSTCGHELREVKLQFSKEPAYRHHPPPPADEFEPHLPIPKFRS